jgi:C4-dicarboxylate-binding protein DctP
VSDVGASLNDLSPLRWRIRPTQSSNKPGIKRLRAVLTNTRRSSMIGPISRRNFIAAATALVAAPALRRQALADEPLLLRCSLDTAPAHTRNANIRDYLARIEHASAGKIKTQLFESGQLFPDAQVGKALLQGQIEMAMPGSWSLTGIAPDADFLQLPILYGRAIDVVHRAVDGRPGQLLAAQIEQKLSAHVIGPWLDLGFFNWYSTSKDLSTYADLKGMKIRNNGGAGQAWRTQFMGAVPNTTPLPALALALSQGTFDGLITSFETIASGQYWDAGIRHGLEDHQFVGEYIPIVNLAFWKKLSPDLQQILTDVWRENIATYRANMADAQSRARELVKAHGITIVVPAAGDLTLMRRDMLAAQEEMAKLSKISPDMLAAVSAEIGAAG